jgi:YHS domain-containing protein
MKRNLIFVLVLLTTIVFAVSAMAAGDAPKGKPQTECPVLGGKIDKSVYTDYQGKRIYFCCSACIDDFKKDPEKYLKKLEEQGVTLEKSPG